MIILGVDPGLGVSGFAILKKSNQSVFLLDYGYLALPSTKTIPFRVNLFHDFFSEKITHYQVTTLALETPFLGKNAQSFLKLGYLRGILYLLGNQNNMYIKDFSPREVKQMITGFGGASKEQVARVVYQLFPALNTVNKMDITDALAISLCGLWQKQ